MKTMKQFESEYLWTKTENGILINRCFAFTATSGKHAGERLLVAAHYDRYQWVAVHVEVKATGEVVCELGRSCDTNAEMLTDIESR